MTTQADVGRRGSHGARARARGCWPIPASPSDELAERFQIEREELESELELLPMCGLPPYTADRLIDVVVGDDGAFSVRLAEYFERPLRLTPAEGVALLAAGRTLFGGAGLRPGRARSPPPSTSSSDALGATGALAVDVAGARSPRAAARRGRARPPGRDRLLLVRA